MSNRNVGDFNFVMNDSIIHDIDSINCKESAFIYVYVRVNDEF